MIRISQKDCDVCGTCISVCSENALKIVKKLEVDKEICISCGKCVVVCPYAALEIVKD